MVASGIAWYRVVVHGIKGYSAWVVGGIAWLQVVLHGSEGAGI